MTEWTDPDHADEEWVQPWEEWEEEFGSWRWRWKTPTPMYLMAEDEWMFCGDFFDARPRWVSDR